MNKIAWLILLLPLNAFGQNALDLKQVIRAAKLNNPKLLALKERVEQARTEKKLTSSFLYPNISLALSGNYQKDAVFSGSPRFGGDPYNQYTSDLKLIQPLYSKGLYSAIKVDEVDIQIQETNLEVEERELTKNIIEAFYRFILNQQTLENLMKNQEIIQKSLSTSQKRYETGRGELLDILQVRTQLALIQPQVELARNQYEVDGLRLINFMGERERENFKIKGHLKTLLYKNIEKYIDLQKFRFPEYELNQLQLSQIGYEKDVTLGKHYPNVRLVGDYLYNNFKKEDLYSDFSNSWVIQLQINIPIFSGLSSQHEKNIITSRDLQLRIARRDLENNLTLEQVSSLKNLKSVESSLVSSESAVRLAVQAQTEASRLYRLSQIDFLQFLTVQQAALQAKSSLDSLKFQSILAYANYFAASGQSMDVLVDILSAEGDL